MNTVTSPSVEWRPDRRSFWLGLVSSLLPWGMLIFLTACILHPEWKFENDWTPTVGDLFACYTLLIIYALAGCLILWGAMVSRFRVDNGLIERTGPLYNYSIPVGAIERIESRTPQLLELIGPGKRVFLNLGVFPNEMRNNILGILRQQLANRPASGWAEFEAGLNERRPPRVAIPHSDRWLFRASLLALLFNVLFALYLTDIYTVKSQAGRALSTFMFTGVSFGAPNIFLLGVWELIWHRRTWRTLAAIIIAGLANYLAVQAFYTMVRHSLSQ